MTDYSTSRWADKAFADGYADRADAIIFERRRLIGVLKSFYSHHYGTKERVHVLDLGCGDGTLTEELAKEFGNVVPTLMDGSEDMLAKAQIRLGECCPGASYECASFQEVLAGDAALPEADFMFSSLAIHHLDKAEKAALFRRIHARLINGGHFVNVDVVLPPPGVEGWYLKMWREWIDGQRHLLEVPEDSVDIPSQYKGNTDNKPDSLASQMRALFAAGFRDVDCYYKHGLFAVYGGKKVAREGLDDEADADEPEDGRDWDFAD
ncbi:MAG: class I SAM-dependent methyltransferase [Nitrospirae bacterium]|nr:class I SAM-dependent methyltransferase [Nitrospirota bacterium]